MDLPAHGPDLGGGADRRLANVARPHRVHPLRVDWLAVGLLVITFGALLAAVSNFSRSRSCSPESPSWLGPCCGGGWPGPVESARPTVRGEYPYRQLALVVSLTLVAMIRLSSYLPVYVRGARGGTAAAAAWSVLWLTLGWTTAANVSGRITDRVSERAVLRVAAIGGIPAVAAAWAAVSFSTRYRWSTPAISPWGCRWEQ